MLWKLREYLNVELVSVLINLISNHLNSFGLMAISMMVTDTCSPAYGSHEEVSIGGKASFWAFRPRPINHELIQVNYTKKRIISNTA